MNILEKAHVIHRSWRYRLRHERDSIKYVLGLNLDGATVLDIGANKGIYTYWLSKKVGKDGKVIAFEPQPELGEYLNDLKNSFGISNATIINKGLSYQIGSLDLYRGKVGSGGARIAVGQDDEIRNQGLQKVKVEVTTLDSFLENSNENIRFIKCDVEGHELSVFKGGEKTLRKNSPTILFECHHEEAINGELFSFLTDLGYNGFFIKDGKEVDFRKFAEFKYNSNDNHRNYIFKKDSL